MKFLLLPFHVGHAQKNKCTGLVHHAPVGRAHHEIDNIAPVWNDCFETVAIARPKPVEQYDPIEPRRSAGQN